ncbi:hypothetical protein GCM10025867_22990 [Frondihabitans sucicola]|uniref:Type II toxin-antitoxin system ParD family antitoxin n=1 Tax=Frondihabitans sucicola TaxID=1268041 RepID=A0ABN6Y229_9MICO|nr:hypothetical protein [Frondihabitans sucicola]BDZ50058.1 hypothetical protein GCM10025867_22990 [Frondihabitans sucicola]
MSTVTHRWTKSAVLARLAASDAIDHDTAATPRERAERRIDLLRVAGAVEDGRLDADSAEAEFRHIRELLQSRTAA